jgi:hypothetical protein
VVAASGWREVRAFERSLRGRGVALTTLRQLVRDAVSR